MESNSVTSDLPAPQQQTALSYPQGLPVGSPWPEEADGGDGIRVSSLLHSLRRQWLPALGIGIVTATLLSALLWLLIPVEFQAEAVLRVNRDAELVGGTRRHRTISDYMTYKETQATLLTSSFVINAALRDNAINQLPMVRFDRLGKKRDRPVAWLEDAIKVDLAGESELLRVRLRGESREQTEQVLNAVVKAYESEIVSKERLEKVEMLQKLRTRYRANFEEISKKGEQVQKLAEQLGSTEMATVQSEQRIRLQELQSNKRDLDNLRKELADAIAEYSLLQINAQFGTSTPSEHAILDELEKDGEFLALRYQISELKDQLEAQAAFARPGAPSLSGLQQEIALLQQKQDDLREALTPRVVERLQRAEGESDQDRSKALIMQQAMLQNLVAQVQRSEQAYATQLKLVRELGGYSGDLDARIGELNGLKETQRNVRKDMQALEIELEAPKRINVVQPATTPNDSNWKLKLGEILGAWLLTLGVVVCGVAYWDYLGKRVNNSEDLTRASAVRVVGTLPAVQQHSLIPFMKMGREALESAMHVSIDGIRTALLYNRQQATQVVMVTSATGHEGRSTVACQLAVSMARAGKRTLLLDGDLRSPQQHLIFGVESRAGICEMLRGEVTADQAILPTAAENVWLLAAGRCDQIALQGLSSDQAGGLFKDLRERFDVIIVDSSPVLTSADALLLGQFVDTALISVRRDVSQLNKVNAACDRLTSVGIHVLGAVVNGTDVELRRGELGVAEANTDQPALTNA